MNRQNTDFPGWDPLTGPRIFRSANAAFEKYGQYRFDVSKRNFLMFVGKGKACPPRDDGSVYVEDVEIIGNSRGWPPTPSFVWRDPQGGEGGGASAEEIQYGALYQKEKALKEAALREKEELLLQKMRGDLIAKSDHDRALAAAAVVVGSAAETWAYDKARDLIHQCCGDPAQEDTFREYLLREVRGWLHAFSRPQEYVVDLEDPEFADAGASPAPVEREDA